MIPHSCTASIAYSEQVGRNLQLGVLFMGEIYFLYSVTGKRYTRRKNSIILITDTKHIE